MGYFINNKTVIFDNLRQAVDIEGKRIYSEELIQKVENRDFKYLLNLDLLDRNNKDFMEPLLYAVKNSEFSTYEIYKYYGESLQKEDLTIATEIVMSEPEIIEGTPVSNNRTFIKKMAEIKPEVVIYMSENLKDDSTFTQELCELNIQDVTMHVANECKAQQAIIDNPILASNFDFMKEAIKSDTECLNFASNELKNDYQFMKEVSKKEETIDYVIEHIEDFGEKGLCGTKDALVEKSSDDAILGFEEEQKNVKKQIEENSKDNLEHDSELEELLKRDKQLQRHIKFFEKIKNGEVDPVRAAKLIDKVCVNLDENYKEQIKKVLKLDEAILQKQKESEKKGKEQQKGITHEDIEKMTPDASFAGIEEETGAIRKTIETERTQNDNELGEGTNDKSDDERT